MDGNCKPILEDARKFANGVRAHYPGKWLAYNLSPSFNWDASGMSDDEIRDFTDQLGKLGYVWQFITLAGFHANGLIIDTFAREFSGRDKMLAYVKRIQRLERNEKVETLTHQKWSGAELIDRAISIVSGGSSFTKSMGKEVTEKQFDQHEPIVHAASRNSKNVNLEIDCSQ